VIVGDLRVGETVDIEPHAGQGLASRLLQKRAAGDTVGVLECSALVAVRIDEFLETRQVPGDTGERVGKRLDPLDLILRIGVRHLERRDGDLVIVPEPVAGRRRIDGDHTEQLGVDPLDVVTLLKGVHDDFPVAVHALAHVQNRHHLVEVVRLHELEDLVAEELGERRGIGIRVHEDEAGEGLDRHRQEAVVGLVEVTDEIGPRHTAQLPLEVVGPEMVRTHEPCRISTSAGTQDVAAMSAGIDESAQLPVVPPHDQE
jgi:hypothetical protein